MQEWLTQFIFFPNWFNSTYFLFQKHLTLFYFHTYVTVLFSAHLLLCLKFKNREFETALIQNLAYCLNMGFIWVSQPFRKTSDQLL